jgi:D-lactate dehydrogenase
MKIAFFDMEKWEIRFIKKNLLGHELLFFSKPIKKVDIQKFKNVEGIASFIFSPIDKKLIDSLPNLKFVTTMSTGYDHIDLEECKRRDIIVCNVPSYGENTVAEHTFALILALSRKIYPSIRKTKKGQFNQDGLVGFDLQGKTLGLIGTGRISYNVARMANGFDMKILGYDLYPNKEFEKLGLKYVSLDELLKNSDIVSLHVPFNKHTEHLIDRKRIKLMKKGAVIINTARGGLIDTLALSDALGSEKIAGAGLDVLEEEQCIMHEDELLREKFRKSCNVRTMLENYIMMKRDNVVITPHNAFNSQEALQRIIDTTIENVVAFSKGKSQNVVKITP